MVSYVVRYFLRQILLFGPLQTSDKTALEEHLYLLLDCRGAHGAHVAVHGQQTIHFLSKVWSRSE